MALTCPFRTANRIPPAAAQFINCELVAAVAGAAGLELVSYEEQDGGVVVLRNGQAFALDG